MGDKPLEPKKTNTPISIGGFNVDVKRPSQNKPPLSKEPTQPKEPTIADLTPPSVDDPQIDKVIDDIVMSESNEVLAAEDAMYMASLEQRPKKKKEEIYFQENIKK